VLRLDRTTGQLATVFTPSAQHRYTWETPLAFSPRDSRTLYVGMQSMLKTTDGAKTWKEISPDLTEKTHTENASGVITTFALSAADSGEIWVGTSTGLVQLTRNDGKAGQMSRRRKCQKTATSFRSKRRPQPLTWRM
jgi:hypothetical protein